MDEQEYEAAVLVMRVALDSGTRVPLEDVIGHCPRSRSAMSPIIEESRESLLERRRALLERLGVPEEDFRRAIATRMLSADDWEAKEELDEIGFLLGDPAA